MFNHYLDERSKIMKNTPLKVEDIFGDMPGKDSISPEQLTEPNELPARLLRKINLA